MRPKLLTPRRLILFLIATVAVVGLARWASLGFPFPGQGVPSTAGKLAFVAAESGKANIALLDPKEGVAQKLTTDGQGNDEPIFSTDGNTVYFTSERGGVRQLCAMDAAPGRIIAALTRTSTTKQLPRPQADGRIYFLDSGRISSTTRDASDAKAIFPTAEELNENPYLKSLFSEGGIATMLPGPDGKSIAFTVKREQGQVLALYLPEEVRSGEAGHEGHEHTGVTVVLGMGERILPQYASDGTLGALFIGGSPFNAPIPVPASPHGQAEQLQMMGEVRLPIPAYSEALKDVHALVPFDGQFKPKGQFRLPIAPREVAFAPGKDLVAMVGPGGAGATQGLLVVGMTGEQIEPKILYDKACQDISWSPDASKLAFSDGTDIFVVPADGSTPPENITRGQAGKATRPVWSPQREKQ
jgi:hypothetical protein